MHLKPPCGSLKKISRPYGKQYLDVSKAHRPELEQKRVNVDFPVWMIHSLDKEAKRLGVPRQFVIRVWVAEHQARAQSFAK